MLDQLKTIILQQFALYPYQNLEIEARFGTVKNDKFVNEIIFNHFDRLKNFLGISQIPIITKTREYRRNNIRKITEFTDQGETISWMTKEQKYSHDDINFGIRLSVSLENSIEPIPETEWIPTLLRVKTRYSYLIENGTLRVDLTEVDQTIFGDNQETVNRFEVEVELLDKGSVDSLFINLETIFRSLHGTEQLWTFPERQQLITYTNQLLGGKVNLDYIDSSRIRQARNLRWNDLVYGGIVGNDTYTYCVFHKADGVRKIIVNSPNGIWSIYQQEFNRITIEVPTKITGTILYVEDVPRINRLRDAPDTEYWWLVFDCVASDVFKDLSEQTIGQRMETGQSIVNIMKSYFYNANVPVTIDTMRFSQIKSIDGFFNVFSDFITDQDNLPFKNDGLIIFPFNSNIQPYSDKKPLNERILTKYPDVCKWKPSSLLTNDLMIEWKIRSSGERYIDVLVLDHVDELIRINGVPASLDYESRIKIIESKLTSNIVAFKWNSYHQSFVYFNKSFRSIPMSIEEATRKLAIVLDQKIPPEKKRNIIFDFRIIPTSNSGYRLAANKTVNILFRGSERFPFNPSNIVVNDIISNISSGAIVEFAPRLDNGNITIVPLRIRHDKTTPNRLDIAIDNWELSMDPIPETTLLGQDTKLFDHNLYQAAVDTIETLPDKDKVLVVTSDTKFDSISNYITPNQINNTTFNKYNYIVFYRSLNSLSPQTANSLLNRLSVGTKVLIIDLNSDRLKEFFKPSLTDTEYGSVTLQPLKITNIDTTTYKIEIQDYQKNLVTTQQFYYHPLSDILALGYNIDNVMDVDSEKQLYTISQRQWAFMHFIIHLSKSIMTTAAITHIPIIEETKENKLPFLPVEIPYKIRGRKVSIETGVTANGDDRVEQVKCSWYDKPVFRIATIGGGDCFFHALLKGIYKPYQDNNEAAYRIDLVKKFRKQLADYLPKVYDTVANGSIADLGLQQKLEPKLIDEMGVDYSLAGMKKLLDSDRYVGDEVYRLTSDVVDVDIYILRADTQDLYIHINTVSQDKPRKSIVIMGNASHYEVIAVEVDNSQLLQTYFPENHPFIHAIQLLQPSD